MFDPKAIRWVVLLCASIVTHSPLFSLQSLRAQDSVLTMQLPDGPSFEMVRVEGGTFTMGATDNDPEAWDDETPAHQVTLSSFRIGQTEVTQALWQAVMGTNPSYFTGDLQRPVEQVTWVDCEQFITKLNQMTGKNFRLPTEAEWEFAALGGTASHDFMYSGSNNANEVAWHRGNAQEKMHPSALLAHNELGLYDMSGNVWEWCADYYGEYPDGHVNNPTGPATGEKRVVRGGSFSYEAAYSRCKCRNCLSPNNNSFAVGLRLAM